MLFPRRTFPSFGHKNLALISLIGLFCCLLFSPAAWAGSKVSPPPAALATPLNPIEAQKLLDVLNNPKERENFTHTLSLMVRSNPSLSTSHTPSQLTATSYLLPTLQTGFISLRLQTGKILTSFLGLFTNIHDVGLEAQHQLTTPELRAGILTTLTQSVCLFALGLALERYVNWSLRRPLHRLGGQARQRDTRKKTLPPHHRHSHSNETEKAEELRATDQRRQAETLRFLTRIPYVVGFFILKSLPVLAFYALICLTLIFLPRRQIGADISMSLANIYVGARILYLCANSILAPYTSTIRLFPVSDATALLLTRWWKYLILPPVFIIILVNFGALHFILRPQDAEALIRILVLVEHILVAVFVLRIRHIVSFFLTPKHDHHTVSFWGFFATITQLWWIPALFLDLSLWVVWAARLPGGYHWIVITTAATIGALITFRIVAILAYGVQNSLFRLTPSLIKRFPDLQQRADRYYPLARSIVSTILIALTTVTITAIWGLPSYTFFVHNPLGQYILITLAITLIAVIIAVIIWEIMNAFLLQKLTYFEQTGMVSRAARLKTVLPIIRTFMLALIVIIVIVTTLSQMGVNVTPLLTGAGILGAAIAFGSQSLVKDFITGFFMLVEDAIQVGDWVKAGGVSGTVENLSIRTVRIRDTFGDLHIIPFSSVSSITNSARGLNKIVIKQQLDMSEDLPRVVEMMANVIDDMRHNETFGPLIHSDYTDLGVDDSSHLGATLIGSVMTSPMMAKKVRREFNRRITTRFAEEGVKFFKETSYITSPPYTPLHVANDTGPLPPSNPI